MTPEITFENYRQIGMMETALSEHADEAFFELTPERQKLACKVFKCLTETDRENREIRRAMTIEKICAVTGAEFSDVANIIETFRKEGRTFLMPPPEFKLTGNSLIDISHESLIRKWERLKIWVEEEGQSARTYRRLSEDAYLHAHHKVGFWSDPELKDALEWRENFKPNETWAELYGEQGERQYRAAFTDSMNYLDHSKLDRDKHIAKEKRQRRILFALSGLFFFTTLVAIAAAVAAYTSTIQANENLQIARDSAELAKSKEKEARDLAAQLSQNKIEIEKTNDSLRVSKDKLEKSETDLKKNNAELEESQKSLLNKTVELKASLANAEDQRKIAQQQKVRADTEAQTARLNAEARQKALEEQKRQSERAETIGAAGEINRSGLVFIEQKEFERAVPEFQKLLAMYEDQTKPFDGETRNDGKWWALHNLGIAYSNLPKDTRRADNFKVSECSYKKSLNVLQDKLAVLNMPGERFDVSDCPPGQPVEQAAIKARDAKPIDEINRSQVTTLRRFAQLYREQAENSTNESEARRLNDMAIENYKKLLEILPKEIYYEKQKIYHADVYVEIADTLQDLNGWSHSADIWNYYSKAMDTYRVKREFVKEVYVRKKIAEFMINYDFKRRGVIELLEEAIRIQEDKNRMNLPPIDADVADSYNRLARGWEANKDSDQALAYEELAKMISDMNFQINKPDGFKVRDFVLLALKYTQAGKCERGRDVFTYGIAQNKVDVNFGQYILSSAAQFHKYVLRDQNEVKKYFDGFYKEFKANPEDIFAYGFLTDYESAGDFYLSQAEYTKANELYERALTINEERIRSLKSLIDQPGNPKQDKSQLRLNQKNAEFTRIEIIGKIAQIFAAQNQWQEAETKYAETDRLLLEVEIELNSNNVFTMPVINFLISQGDVYHKAGKEEKAKEVYEKAEHILTKYFRKEMTFLAVRVQKRLGDVNRNNPKTAAEYYNTALKSLDEIFKEAHFSSSQANQSNRSFEQTNKLNAEFYNNKAEILEALIGLGTTENTDNLKEDLDEARSMAEELKTLEEKTPCQ